MISKGASLKFVFFVVKKLTAQTAHRLEIYDIILTSYQ